MEILKFKPLEFSKERLNIKDLNIRTGKEWRYASSGKAALYHCLKSLGVEGVVLIPAYVCKSILKPIEQLNLKCIYYDVNSNNLNVSIDDLEYKLNNNKVDCVIIASMYGNPADMVKAELLCKEHNILLVDDAAQSFEAKINDRYIGTFGDAGFFSLSPGKATSGHLGAFFWTSNKEYTIKRTNHFFIHFVIYLDFLFNRYHIYRFKKIKIFVLLTYFKILLLKMFDLNNDKINFFEKNIIGGILKANKDQTFRKRLLKKLDRDLKVKDSIVLITSGNKGANNHKIVIVCNSQSLSMELMLIFNQEGVYATNGYELLNNGKACPNAKNLVSRIIEIPLEDSVEKLLYIKKILIKNT